MSKNTCIDDYSEIELYLGYQNLYCGLWMAFMDQRLFDSLPGINVIDDIELDSLTVIEKSGLEMSFVGTGDLRVDRHYSSDDETAFTESYPFKFQARGQFRSKELHFDEFDLLDEQ